MHVIHGFEHVPLNARNSVVAIGNFDGVHLGHQALIHALIADARRESTEALKNFIYEKRVLAETALSRPVMKAFKAMIRQEGLFAGLVLEEETE